MCDLVMIHGPSLSSFIRNVLSSEGDFDGILMGYVRTITEDVKDDHAESCTKTVVEACVTSIQCFPSTLQWYTPAGHVDGQSLRELMSKLPQHTGSHFIGWAAHRAGSPPGWLSVRDRALCANMVAHKAEILETAAAASKDLLGSVPDAATWPLLLLQAEVSSQLDDAILQVDTSVSELRCTGAGEGGAARGLSAVRRPLHVQNISKLGGLHLYKHFKPSTAFPLDFNRQMSVTDKSQELTETVQFQYQEGLQSTQAIANLLQADLGNLRKLKDFAARFESQLSGSTPVD